MKRHKMTTLQIGSYSHGTMREEDLIPTFLSMADDLRMSRADRKRVNAIARASDVDGYYDTEDAVEDCVELFDILDGYTPTYCYFGAHPGDGSDYGVWVVEELFNDYTQGGYDGDVWRTGPGRMNVPKDYGYRLDVNDHGNATLYRRLGKRNAWREVWSIV